jgi:hypothetical protein
MENMGRQRLVNKTVGPAEIIKALQTGSITTAQAQAMFNGVIPIGDYKGVAAILDLDKLVVQPLVWPEQLHILGNLDGATEDTDLQTITVPAGALATAVVGETLTVPAGEVWYINAVVGTCLADATGTIVYNWRCSLFPDALGSPLGGVYHTNWIATPLGPQFDEFSAIATLFAVGNKPIPLRLPAGATITGQLMNAAGAAAATGVAGTLQLYGWRGKALVA